MNARQKMERALGVLVCCGLFGITGNARAQYQEIPAPVESVIIQRLEAGPQTAPKNAITASTVDARVLRGRIEDYLNSFKTAQARFLQVTADDARATGRFYLQRPGRFRLEYDPPPAVLVLADKYRILYVDRDLDEQTYIRQSDVPIAFLLREKVTLDSPLIRTAFFQTPTHFVAAVESKKDSFQPISFYFSKPVVKLEYWTFRDEYNRPVVVKLSQLKTGVSLAEDLFTYRRQRRSHR